MKKVLALALALVMAFSCGFVAFAEEDTTATTAAEVSTNVIINNNEGDTVVNEAIPENAKCGLCGSVLADGEKLADHECPTEAATEKDYIDLTVKEVLAMILDLAKAGMTQWADVETVIIKIVDFLDGLVSGITSGGSVDGLVAELEGLFEGIEIPGIDELISALKEKILSFYAPGVVIPTTKPADTSNTGSAPVGIAVFAAVSVAAAAAFVCTKKN